ncbi:Tim17/Tim22/Tim23/Pmp24 family-domain-containing protein [Baffinella frigidus]|nr:Tim17/Tim22/Tim23/Pmp24 family-domain-containing protein [Cryptophyta sp. CCMP2293]
MADSHEREPCPHRIIDDLGGAFAFGVVGGGLFHTFKGARNAPRGERTAGVIQAVKANARRLGGSFAVWGGLFSTFDCCFIAIRSKEDPYNSIMSGFCTGASLAARGGSKAALKSGMVGGIILAVIEGLNIAITRIMNQLPPPEEMPSPGAMPAGAGGAADGAPPVPVPWWAAMFAGPPPKEEVDFSDPKEMAAAPAFGAGKDDFSQSEKKWASPLEPQVDAAKLVLLMRAHVFARGQGIFARQGQDAPAQQC